MIAAERNHGKRVAANFADRAGGSSSFFRTHGCCKIDTEIPVSRLINKRNRITAAPAENKGTDRYTFRIFPVGIKRRTLTCRRGKTGIRMRRNPSAIRRPAITLPIDQFIRWNLGHALPPDISVRGHGDIGKDTVLCKSRHGIRIRLFRGTRSNAEKAIFRVNSMKATIITRLDPRNIISDSRHLPALKRFGGNKHGKICLTTGTRECGANIRFFTFRRFNTENQHMLCKPAFIPGHGRCNT